MIFRDDYTDATIVYRESSGVQTVRTDGTENSGSLVDIMKDSILVLGPVGIDRWNGRMPEGPEGTLDALSRS